jgi:hypothetical protein
VEKIAAVVIWALVLAGIYGIGLIIADNNGPPTASTASVQVASGDDTGAAVTPVSAAAAGSAAAHTHTHAAAVDDRGFSKLENGDQHAHGFTQAVSPTDRALLARQLELARQVALQYPTVADAERAGLHRAGPFSPGLGAHYISYGNALSNTTGVMTDDNIRRPLAWIYDGTKPDSRIAGLFYMTGVTNPQGFAGPNDTWHVHHDICIKTGANGVIDAPLGADHDATPAQCDAVGGNLLQQTQNLVHVWAVPGYESPEGVFSHLTTAVTCADGTYDTIADVTKVGSATTMCKDGAE